MPRPADGPVLPALDQYDAWMDRALDEARAAAAAGDVPVGAVVVQLNEDRTDGVLVAARHNERELTGDPTAHAEVLAVRHAALTLGRWRLDDCLVVVTLEPCPMCAGALWASRVAGVVYGADDMKAGATGSLYHLGPGPEAEPRVRHPPRREGARVRGTAPFLFRPASGR